ncbi:MAG: NAD(P)/FAD-dependent oxidoreductase [Sporichthyaceae bacterium]
MSSTSKARNSLHRVVVIGSGFGGLYATRALKKANCQVTVIARTSHHLFQPMLYQVATAVVSEGEIAPQTREVLNRQHNARVILGEVVKVDLNARTVTSTTPLGEKVTPYDTLIVAAGAGQSYFGNDQFTEYAPGMKTIDDALELRGRIFGAFELAEIAPDEATRERMLTFVVVGAGPTGVEMAGQISELAHKTLRKDFRVADTRKARVILLDAVDKVLPQFGGNLSESAHRELEKSGVEVELGKKVVDMDGDGVVVEDHDGNRTRIEARCKVWAAGVSASPLGKQLVAQSDAELDRVGRVVVNSDLSLPGRPEVYVIGDMANKDNLPGVAQVAMQGAKHVAKEIKKGLAGRETGHEFKYFDKGSMAMVTRFHAVAKIGKLQLHGFIAWNVWLIIHLMYLVGYRNRLTCALRWTANFIGHHRSERTITHQQVLGRRALLRLQEGRTDDPWGLKITATAGPEHVASVEPSASIDSPVKQSVS